MSRTYNTHDGWAVTLEAMDSQVHWTETGGDDPNPRMYSLNYEEVLRVADLFRAREQEFREYAPHSIPIISGLAHYQHCAADAAQIARLADFAATTIAK